MLLAFVFTIPIIWVLDFYLLILSQKEVLGTTQVFSILGWSWFKAFLGGLMVGLILLGLGWDTQFFLIISNLVSPGFGLAKT